MYVLFLFFIEIDLLQGFEFRDGGGDFGEIVFIENDVFDVFKVAEGFRQRLNLVSGHYQVFALQFADVVGQFLDAVVGHQEAADLGEVADVGLGQVHLVLVEVDFLQAVEFGDPGGDVFDLVIFEVEGFEVFTPFNIGGDAFEVLIGEGKVGGVVVHKLVCRAGSQQRQGEGEGYYVRNLFHCGVITLQIYILL